MNVEIVYIQFGEQPQSFMVGLDKVTNIKISKGKAVVTLEDGDFTINSDYVIAYCSKTPSFILRHLSEKMKGGE
ncbi:hypothetical protein [Atopococcus tabaci]|uniref:hypothetical protein n=1 Tax=Atopococcus tabaci TaxID=269774 RepID=UPI00048431BD|nr:hypothetical protein [Atopococcus tabaci]